MDEDTAGLVDALEAEHRRVKRAYFAWCSRQDGLVSNGVGSGNNKKTGTFLETNPDLLSPVNVVCSKIAAASRDLSPEEKYDLMREAFFVHPSFHETWWIDKHFSSNLERVLFKAQYFALNKLAGHLDNNTATIKGTATFLARYVILFENLLSSRLTTSLFDASADEAALQRNVKEAVDTWGTLSISEFVKEMPVLFSIARTLLEMTGSRGLEPAHLLDTRSWMVNWAQCSINEGPLFTKTSNLSRTEIFRSLPSLTDQEAIRSHLRQHFAVSLDEYYDRILPGFKDGTPSTASGAGSAAKTPSERPRRTNITQSTSRPDITERIEHWRDSRGLVRYPAQGLTAGGRQYVAFLYGGDKKTQHDIVNIRNDTTLTVELKKRATKPPIMPLEIRLELVSRLNRALGQSFSDGMAAENVQFPLSDLDSPEKFAAFTGVLDWVMAEVRRSEPGR